jgi:carboxylesterase
VLADTVDWSFMLPAAGGVGAVVLAAAIGWRAYRLRRVEEAWVRAHPVGPDGLVPGAQGIALDAARIAPGGAPPAVLLLHGFGDTPQTVARQAQALHLRGWTVRAPLLPGHGRSLAAFRATDARDWHAAARHAYLALAAGHDRVAIVGLSMGGALATSIAAEAARQAASGAPEWRAPRAVALIAPFLEVSPRGQLLTAIWPLWSLARAWIPGQAEASIHDPRARAASLGYGLSTPRLLRQLRLVVDAARAAAPQLRAPTLMVCSTQDYRVPRATVERAYARLGATEKQLTWVERSGHVITVDYDADRVTAAIVDWLERHADRPT